MSSEPAVNGRSVTKELHCFFQVEIENGTQGGVSPATLGSAHDSLCQAPYDVVCEWMGVEGEATHMLIEFGSLLFEYGDEARLSAFTSDDPEGD